MLHRSIALSLTLILICLPLILAVLPTPPGLYLDRVTLGVIGGPIYQPSTVGYNFAAAWRQTLPGLVTYGMGLVNFATGPHKLLSFVAQLQGVTTSGGVVNVKPDIPDAGFVYLVFTVVIITEDNPRLQLKSLTLPTVNSSTYLMQSSKFSFGGSDSPFYTYFFQWIIARDISNETSSTYWVDYFAYMTVTPSTTSSSQLQIDLSRQAVYMRGMKMNAVLLSRQNITAYENLFQNGDHGGSNFTNNLGIDTSLFGSVDTGTNCLMGLISIDIYFFRAANQSGQARFVFTWAGDQITDIPYNNAFRVRLNTACYGGGIADQGTPTSNDGESPSSSSSSSSNIIAVVVGSVIGAITFLGIAVLLIFCYCCRHQQPQHPQSVHSEHRLNVASESNMSHGWFYKDYSNYEHNQCSICLANQCNIITNCKHCFHMGCILSWGNKTNTCPNCRKQIKVDMHELVCMKCFAKSQPVTFDKIKELSEDSNPKAVLLCGTCRNKKKAIET